MSLILDALRKMEQERKTRMGATGDLRPEVLRYRAAVQPRKTNVTLVGGAAAAILAVGVVGGVVWHGARQPAMPAAAVVAQASAPVPASLPSAVPAPVAPVAQAPAAAPVAPVSPVAPVAPASVPQVAVPRAVAPQPAPSARTVPPQPLPRPIAAGSGSGAYPSEERATSAASAAAGKGRSHRGGRAVAPAEGMQAAPADVTISGIAWQEERAMRRAVVNGTLVGEGADVAGARVVEIREDRVRFSRGGQSFEVPYTTNLGAR